MTATASGVREYVWLVKESAFGVPKTSPVAGTDSLYIRLVEGNSFSMVASPVIEDIPYGGGLAINADAVSDHYECKGGLKTKLYPAQAKLLVPWLATRINSGQTAPWTTTEPPGDLASCTVYHAVRRSDGTFKRLAYRGVKCAGGTIDVSRGSTTATISLDLVGSQSSGNAFDGTPDPDTVEFPPPADADFPLGPFTFVMTRGHLSVGSTRTQYESLSIKFQNAMDPRWFENSYVTINPFCGRSTTLEAALMLKATPDDRSDFEAITAKTASVEFHNGVTGQNMTIQFNGNNHVSALPFDLPLNQVFMQPLTLMNKWDAAASSSANQDVTVTFA